MSNQPVEAQITLYREELPVHVTIQATYTPGRKASGGYSNPGATPEQDEEISILQCLTENGEAFDLQPGERAEAEEAVRIEWNDQTPF